MSFTRRAFMLGGGLIGGGLVVGVTTVGAWVGTFDRRALQQEQLPEGRTRLVSQWIRIEPDNTVTVLTPHVEMGQGSHTGVLQIVLDELDVDPALARVEVAPASSAFTIGDVMAGFVGADVEGFSRRVMEQAFGRIAALNNWQFTGGSTAIRFTGWRGIRHGAAAARQMLKQAAAIEWGVDPSSLTTHESHVVHAASTQSASYAELASAAARLPLPSTVQPKPRDQWRYIGTSHPRIDLPDKIFATAEYGIDRVVEGMRYAAVAPPTTTGGTVQSITNTSEVSQMPGVEAVLNLEHLVAVVADKPWRAERAVRAVTQECTPPEGGPLDSEVLVAMRQEVVRTGELSTAIERGEGATAHIAEATRVLEAEYTLPFLAHAPMEPMNATIWNEGGKIHLATGTQDPLATVQHTAEALGRPPEDIVVHPHTIGGGFGRRAGLSGESFNWVRAAAQLHGKVGGALKMIWSREAGIHMSSYRPADVAWLRASVDAEGLPTAWWSRHYTRIFAPPEAIPPYAIPHVTAEHAALEPALPYAFWRSVDASIQGFTVESFIDELAAAAQTDPLDYRLKLLDAGSRHARLLTRVADASGWGSAQPEGTALGVALTECFGSIVAQVAQVSIDRDRPKVHRVWAAVDPGLAVNPDSVVAQVQGGIHFGLSAALFGQITLKDGTIRQSNFHDYPVVRFGNAPRIDVQIQQTEGVTIGGIGEVGTPGAAPAVANALAALTERRRDLPLG